MFVSSEIEKCITRVHQIALDQRVRIVDRRRRLDGILQTDDEKSLAMLVHGGEDLRHQIRTVRHLFLRHFAMARGGLFQGFLLLRVRRFAFVGHLKDERRSNFERWRRDSTYLGRVIGVQRIVEIAVFDRSCRFDFLFSSIFFLLVQL